MNSAARVPRPSSRSSWGRSRAQQAQVEIALPNPRGKCEDADPQKWQQVASFRLLQPNRKGLRQCRKHPGHQQLGDLDITRAEGGPAHTRYQHALGNFRRAGGTQEGLRIRGIRGLGQGSGPAESGYSVHHGWISALNSDRWHEVGKITLFHRGPNGTKISLTGEFAPNSCPGLAPRFTRPTIPHNPPLERLEMGPAPSQVAGADLPGSAPLPGVPSASPDIS